MFRVHCAVLNGTTRTIWLTSSQCYGGHGERETPGLIPNPEAKPLSADGTAPGTGWESRTPPDNHSRRGPSIRAGAPSSCPPPGTSSTNSRGLRPRTLADFVHELAGTLSTNSRGLRPRTLADFVHELSRTSSTNSGGL